MEILIESLAQYGPLGLWTASLLYANYQTRKDAKEEERLLQDKVIDKLQLQHTMLEKALEKLDAGLVTMREKYAEERILRMKDNNQ
jgi:phytoene/squalene synthetase